MADIEIVEEKIEEAPAQEPAIDETRLDVGVTPPPEPKPKAKAKAKARTRKPKEEIIVDPVKATTVKFGIENKTNPVLPSKPVRLTKAMPPEQPPPPAPITQLSQEQIMGIISNQRMMKAQRKQQRIQSLVSHAF